MSRPDAPPRARVEEYLRHRAAINARWAVADYLWDAMTAAERVEATQALGDDWRPRR
jgi:hypothetical protein